MRILAHSQLRRTWPAVWEVGDNWPHKGEIDILEGVNDKGPNAVTLHTNAGKPGKASRLLKHALTPSVILRLRYAKNASKPTIVCDICFDISTSWLT